MKKRHSVAQNVKSYVRMIKEGDIRFDFPLQRAKGQWKLIDQSLLIHSITQDYDIPAIYSVSERVQEDGREKLKYIILDGLQRLSTIEDYCTDQFPLHPDTPSARIDDAEYFIADKLFSEQHERVREMIHDFTLSMYYFVNMTEDEMAEMFYRIGNGAAHNKQQKFKSRLGLKKASYLNNLTGHILFKEYSDLTVAQIKKADDERIVIQSLMLADEMFNETYLGFDNPTIERYMIFLKASDNEPLFEEYQLTLDYLVAAINSVDRNSIKVLKKRHLTYIIHLARYAYYMSISEKDFGEALIQLSEQMTYGKEEEMAKFKDIFGQSAYHKKATTIREMKHELELFLNDAVGIKVTETQFA